MAPGSDGSWEGAWLGRIKAGVLALPMHKSIGSYLDPSFLTCAVGITYLLIHCTFILMFS